MKPIREGGRGCPKTFPPTFLFFSISFATFILPSQTALPVQAVDEVNFGQLEVAPGNRKERKNFQTK